MQFCVSKIRTLLFCPKKFIQESIDEAREFDKKLEIKTKRIIKNSGHLKKGLLTTKFFNFELIASNLEVISNENSVTLISHRNGKKLYQYHYIEAAAYGYIFSKYTEKNIKIIFKSKYYTQNMPWEKYLSQFRDIISEIHNTSKIEPRINPECKFCKYNNECTKELSKRGSLSLIRGIGKIKIEELNDKGIYNLDDLIEKKNLVEEMFGEKSKKILSQAIAFKTNKPVLISKVQKLKPGIFLDIESFHDFHFLFGILLNDKYIYFLSEKKDDEKENFLKLIEFLEKNKMPIYHYYNYEPVQIRKLLSKYNIRKKINLNFIDIYKIFSNHIAVPIISYSLKPLARYFGFNWRTNLNGSSVINKFEEYKKTKNKEILNKILLYNEDDVRATKLLFEIVNQFSK